MRELFFPKPVEISPKEDKPIIHETPHFKKTESRTEHNHTTNRDYLTRRKFLIRGALLAAGAIIAKPTFEIAEKVLEFMEPDEISKPTEQQNKILQSDEEVLERALAATRTRVIDQRIEALSGIEPQNIAKDGKTLADRLLLENKKTSFDSTLVADIEKSWVNKYDKGGDLHWGLLQARKEMQPWIAEIIECFRQEGVPEKFAYLAIPESHFQIKAESTAGAKGPYQFTKDTAKSYDLQTTGVVDERFDPIKSAEACAKNLRHIYDKCDDWNIALSGYNGSFIWKYLGTTQRNDRNYLGFLEFISDTINEKRAAIKDQPFYTHLVERNESISKLAADFGVSVSALKQHNHIITKGLLQGQAIQIPLGDFHHRSLVFQKVANIQGLSENLNYPAKFNAIWKVMEKNGLATPDNVHAVPKKKIPVGQEIVYTVLPGDNLGKICAKFSSLGRKIAQQELQKHNGLRSKSLKRHQKLKIPTRSLAEFSGGSSQKLALLEKLNPAVINAHSPLPSGFEVRLA